MILQHGIPAHLIPQAAALYWQAFGSKLGRVMGPEARAHQFLERVIRPDHAVVMLDQGQLVGLAGFKSPKGSFAGGDWPDMRAIYGLSGLLWRAPLMTMLSHEVDDDHFLLDGICVAPHARSRGIGSALLTAIEDEARDRGYGAVRLDVVNTNLRAKALYQRQGYSVTKAESIGLLRYVFGFDAAITMIKAV